MELHDLLKYRNKFSYPLLVQLVSNLQISTFKIIRNHNVTTHISQCHLNSFRLDAVRSFHLAYWSLFVPKNSNLDSVENNFSHSLSVQNRRSLANWRRFVLLIRRAVANDFDKQCEHSNVQYAESFNCKDINVFWRSSTSIQFFFNCICWKSSILFIRDHNKFFFPIWCTIRPSTTFYSWNYSSFFNP